jgi:aminoglycoside phosphotransferase (APT) family kinase protein
VTAIDELNARHGTRFRSAGAYDGGEFGALRLVDESGRSFVLKRQPPGLAPQTTEALRPLGYPAPRYVVCGSDYHVQEELPGEPAWNGWGSAPQPVMNRLLALNEMQADRALDSDTSWPDSIVESVVLGYSEYAVVGTLQRHSDESRELLRLCKRTVERHAEALRGRRDIVHWDYTLSNVLVEGNLVTGVIDWGGTRSGDRLFDLATLIYYARGETPELERYVVDRIGEEGLAVYLAHMAVRQSDWSVRHHALAAGDEVVAYSLELARSFPPGVT